MGSITPKERHEGYTKEVATAINSTIDVTIAHTLVYSRICRHFSCVHANLFFKKQDWTVANSYGKLVGKNEIYLKLKMRVQLEWGTP